MTIKGIRKAVGETRHSNFTCGGRLQISLNLDNGELLTAYHVGENWTVYHDPCIVHVAMVNWSLTMKELKELIDIAVQIAFDDIYN